MGRGWHDFNADFLWGGATVVVGPNGFIIKRPRYMTTKYRLFLPYYRYMQLRGMN